MKLHSKTGGILSALLIGFLSLPAAAGSGADPLAGLDALVEAEMKAANVPGLALAVVRDGEVIHSRTFGFRDAEKKLPVTPDTLFRIGSVTKSMTAASAALLVQRDRLDWDRPVREYLPEFRLQDEVAGDRLSLRDMLTHRSGLPRHDMVWFHENLPRREYVRRLRYLEPSADFRTRFQYNNLIYTAAGYLVGEVAGSSWEQWLRTELFAPLGMDSTGMQLSQLAAAADRALGYGDDDAGKLMRIPDTSVDAIAPAGAVNSSLADMTRYLLMYVNGGRSQDGKQVLDPKVLADMQMPYIPVPMRGQHPEIGATHYGLGLFVSSYRGHRHVYHTGAYEGFNAGLAWLPDEKVGVVILANHNLLMNFLQVITHRAFDQALGLEPIDWRARFGRVEPGARAGGDPRPAQAPKQAPRAAPARALAEYAGRYEHPAYGIVEVRANGNSGLELEFHGDRFPLLPYRVDLFETGTLPNSTHPLQRTKVSFLADEEGAIGSLSMKMESGVKPAELVKLDGESR